MKKTKRTGLLDTPEVEPTKGLDDSDSVDLSVRDKMEKFVERYKEQKKLNKESESKETPAPEEEPEVREESATEKVTKNRVNTSSSPKGKDLEKRLLKVDKPTKKPIPEEHHSRDDNLARKGSRRFGTLTYGGRTRTPKQKLARQRAKVQNAKKSADIYRGYLEQGIAKYGFINPPKPNFNIDIKNPLKGAKPSSRGSGSGPPKVN